MKYLENHGEGKKKKKKVSSANGAAALNLNNHTKLAGVPSKAGDNSDLRNISPAA